MKKYLFFILLVSLNLLSCNNDNELKITEKDPKYDLTDSNDPLQHQKHIFFKKYNVIVIDEPNISDYKNNPAGSSLDLQLEIPEIDDVEKIKILKAFEDSFYSAYDSAFIFDNAPLKLILAQNVLQPQINFMTREMELVPVPTYISNNKIIIDVKHEEFEIKDNNVFGLLMVNGRNQKAEIGMAIFKKLVIENILIKLYGEEDWMQLFIDIMGKDIKGDLYSSYMDKYMPFAKLNFMGNEDLSWSYLSIEKFPYDKTESNVTNLYTEKSMAFMYERGWTSIVKAEYYPSQPPSDYFPGGFSERARITIYVEDLLIGWFKFKKRHTPEEISNILNTYPKMKENYLIFKELIKKYAFIDFTLNF